MDLGLEGRTAVVSGGSTGIGKATAAALLGEGANVALLARTPETLDQTVKELSHEFPDGGVVGVRTDVTDRVSVDAAAATVGERFGDVHVLVVAAGHRMRRLDRQLLWDDEDWSADLDVKTLGMLRVIRAFYPLLDKTGAGRVINVGGVAGHAVWEGALTHGLNNAAMHHATRYLARDLAADLITVNAVIPGLVATEWRHDWAALAAGRQGIPVDVFLAGYLERLGVLLGRWAESCEVADAIGFLASARAAYVTGTSLVVDGGISAHAL
jgi:3-oxoacyl-[acyl-carrier protein] reductase